MSNLEFRHKISYAGRSNLKLRPFASKNATLRILNLNLQPPNPEVIECEQHVWDVGHVFKLRNSLKFDSYYALFIKLKFYGTQFRPR